MVLINFRCDTQVPVVSCFQSIPAGAGHVSWKLRIQAVAVVPDDAQQITAKLCEWSSQTDSGQPPCNLLLTTG